MVFMIGCGGKKIQRDGPGKSIIPEIPDDAVPKPEARSKYGNGRDLGNGPQYEVLEKTYTVMENSFDYQESGVASWYGSKFHGNLTSNREIYDMYKMTAAHKTLPLPTYVHVRNLRNNKTITVRVNDRGPFVTNRIIDLSYAAAMKLDMVNDGTSLVEVTAINFDKPTKKTLPPVATTQISPNQIYVQVGAFKELKNAERRLSELLNYRFNKAFIHEEFINTETLYRVRIGPIINVAQYDLLIKSLEAFGIKDKYLITD
ncbi:MAG: septal ring lytic transglycosylase RlpA family lipoprotein [Gammaproteobacteria bacterium]|nr:septal ring lytic transglycosylase RlpA family lipoprotein [Gammaproteobacteria bacterium]